MKKILFILFFILFMASSAYGTIYDSEGNVLYPSITTRSLECPDGYFFYKIDSDGVLYCKVAPTGSGGGGMIYPNAGIAYSTGSAWGTSITDNHSNWDQAYQYRITTCNAPLSCASNIISINTSGTWPGAAGSLSAAYIDWSASSGGASIKNKPTLPANTSATSSQFFTAYNSTTGAFTKAQPTYSDLGGSVPTWNQNTTGTAAGLSAILSTTYGGTGVNDFSFSGAAHKTASVSGSPSDGCATWSTGQLTSTGSACGASGGMVYPGAGVPISTGSAWDTSITESDGYVLYGDSGAWTTSNAPAISAANMTSFPILNQNTTGTAANLSGTPALPNGTTATTQSAGDNSTKLATTAYVDAAAGVSIAWGDITGTLSDQSDLQTALNAKVPTSTTVNGHALTGNVSVTKSDLSLGNVENTALSTWAGTANITTLGTIGTGTWQGSTISASYIDGAIARLASPTFTGTVTVPTLAVTTINSSGTADNYFAGSVGIEKNSPRGALDVGGASRKYFEWADAADTSNTRTVVNIIHSTTQDMVDGFGANFLFSIEDSAGVLNDIGFIQVIRAGADNSGDMVFVTKNAGSYNTSQLRLDHDGSVGIGKTTPAAKLDIDQDTEGSKSLQYSNSGTTAGGTPTHYEIQSSLQTTDNTVTYDTHCVTYEEGYTTMVTAYITAFEDASGTYGAWQTILICQRATAGQSCGVEDMIHSSGSWTAHLYADTTAHTLCAQVTGANSHTIDWGIRYSVDTID
jgi:hypothetical protein